MEKSNFDRLLQRYLTDQVTGQERIKIEAWLEEVKTDDPRNFEMSKEDEEKVFSRITGNIQHEQENRKSRRLLSGPWVIGIASAIVIFTAWFVLWQSGNTGAEKMILADGTLVWLKGKGNLAYYEKASDGTRHAELNGAALFEVSKDPQHPFILTCGEYTVKVLGTSFSVQPVGQGIELEVLTGKVNLSSTTDSVGIVVESKQKVLYSGQPNPLKEELSADEVTAVIKSTEYDMKFQNSTMAAVLERIEKKFEVSVSIENKELSGCRITADFTDHSLESTMLLISEVLEIKYEVSGKSVAISVAGCSK